MIKRKPSPQGQTSPKTPPRRTAAGRDPNWLRLLMDMPFVGVAVFNVRSQQWVRLNDRFCAIVGYDRKDIARLNWRELCHPEDRVKGDAALQQLIERHGSHKHFKQRLLRKDGSVAHVEIDATDGQTRIGADHVIVALVTEFAHHDTEEMLHAVVKQSITGIYVVENGLITYANLRLTEMFGYATGELLGKSVAEVVAEADRARVLGNMRKRFAGELPNNEYEFQAIRKDGAIIDIDVHASLAKIQNRRVIVGVVRDVTRRNRIERELRDSEERFRAVIEQSIAATYVIQDGRIVYVNPRMREIFGYAPGEPFDPDPLAHVKETDWPRVIDHIRRRLNGEGEAAYTITALHKNRSEFAFGIHATSAVYQGKPAIIAVAQDITERVRAEEDARRYVEGLKKAMRSTVEVVSIIGELRDPYTHGHERRVGEIAAAIGAEMGLDANRVEGIRVAGYLHDVGKIGIPAELLSKPARLTPAEFELIKGHAQQSYEILKGVDFPWPVAQVALQHHERLDGSGYPNGLKGDAIILEARIMSIADVVEAMSSHRPYRPGLGIEKALAEIERGRGTAYDPIAADACLRLFREKGYKLPE